MRFFTPAETAAWCEGQWGPLSARGQPEWPSTQEHHVRVDIPQSFTRLTWFCQHLEHSLQPWDTCLLWVAEWGVWRSSENWHLYYKLRQSYGDLRLLHEAPGHLFLRHEAPDLVSFVQVGILCGWDMHLLPTSGYTRAFLSHDEFVEFASDDNNPGLVAEFAAPLTGEPGKRREKEEGR
jgi:hypothetical protein